jgi:hypothetical protein
MSKEEKKKNFNLDEEKTNNDNTVAPDFHKRKKKHWGHGANEKRKVIKSYKSPGKK